MPSNPGHRCGISLSALLISARSLRLCSPARWALTHQAPRRFLQLMHITRSSGIHRPRPALVRAHMPAHGINVESRQRRRKHNRLDAVRVDNRRGLDGCSLTRLSMRSLLCRRCLCHCAKNCADQLLRWNRARLSRLLRRLLFSFAPLGQECFCGLLGGEVHHLITTCAWVANEKFSGLSKPCDVTGERAKSGISHQNTATNTSSTCGMQLLSHFRRHFQSVCRRWDNVSRKHSLDTIHEPRPGCRAPGLPVSPKHGDDTASC